MPRTRRFAPPGLWYHVTQRGNCRQDVFFRPEDRRTYLTLLRSHADRAGLRVLGYCLMTNHVHLICQPLTPTALATAVGCTHGAYAQLIHRREQRIGHLWQGRFYSCPLDDGHLWAALAYVERNPVRAGLVPYCDQWPWSSAAAHTGGQDAAALIDRTAWQQHWTTVSWRQVLRQGLAEAALAERIRQATRHGRPLGSDEFVAHCEEVAGRRLRAQAIGRPRHVATRT